MSYQILEVSLADLDRLYQYHIEETYGAAFGIRDLIIPG